MNKLGFGKIRIDIASPPAACGVTTTIATNSRPVLCQSAGLCWLSYESGRTWNFIGNLVILIRIVRVFESKWKLHAGPPRVVSGG